MSFVFLAATSLAVRPHFAWELTMFVRLRSKIVTLARQTQSNQERSQWHSTCNTLDIGTEQVMP
jgi:hypothetical protein